MAAENLSRGGEPGGHCYKPCRNWMGHLPTFSLYNVVHIPQIPSTALMLAAKSLQSCPTLCDPIDGSPPGSPIPGILQARTLEWVAISFSNAWKWKVKVKSLSHARLLVTPWTAAYQAPQSTGFSRWKYCRGLPLPSPFAGLEIMKIVHWPSHFSH